MGRRKLPVHLFVSYHQTDEVKARELVAALKGQAANVEIFFAPEKICAGADWQKRLYKEISRADAVILLIGRDVGRWQQEEYSEARDLANSRKSRRPLIIPVILELKTPKSLPFLNRYHRISARTLSSDQVAGTIIEAISPLLSNNKCVRV